MFRFLLLLIFVLHVDNVDGLAKFHYSGQFGCPLANFNYQIHMFEDDDWFYDNEISNTTVVSSRPPHNYYVLGQDTNDGCFFNWCSYNFELYMFIHHNCTTAHPGKIMKAWVDLGEHYLENGDCYRTHNMNLHEKGEVDIFVDPSVLNPK